VLYPDRRGAATAGPAPTSVGRAMWEVKRGALGVGHDRDKEQWRLTIHDQHADKLHLASIGCDAALSAIDAKVIPPTGGLTFPAELVGGWRV